MFITNSFIFLLAGILVVASAAIFAVRYLKPKAAREYDIIFAVMGVIYALCLLLEGWRLIPLLQFAQVLLVALCTFFAVETFRLRLQLVEKSRGTVSPSRPPDRPFDRTYRSGRTVSSRTSESRSRIRQATPEEEEEPPRRRVAAPPKQLPRTTSGSSSRTRRVIRPGEGSLDEEDQAPRRDPESRGPTPDSERPSRRPPPRLPEEDFEEEPVLDVTSEVSEEEPPRRRTRRIVVEEVIDDEEELT